MEKENKKKYYYNNNKKYYSKKKKVNNDNSKEKLTYEKIVNKRTSPDEIDDTEDVYYSDDKVLKIVAVSIMVLAIVFGSLILFRLI